MKGKRNILQNNHDLKYFFVCVCSNTIEKTVLKNAVSLFAYWLTVQWEHTHAASSDVELPWGDRWQPPIKSRRALFVLVTHLIWPGKYSKHLT